MSGIFRDVFLIGFSEASRIEDFTIETDLDSKYEDAELKVKTEVRGSGKVTLKLLDASKSEVAVVSKDVSAAGDVQTVEFSIPVKNPLKWTAETPNLYHVVISLDETQYIASKVGFRKVELKDGLIKVNGKRIVFKGANRHEHHPTLGRTIPYEFLKNDLLIMKTHNINAIRTSHQPNQTALYDLADEIGFWVIDVRSM